MDIDELFEKANEVRPRLLIIAQKIVGDDEEAEDIVQDALLRLWQLKSEDIRDAESMAKVITRNLSIDHVRRRHVMVDIDEGKLEIDEHAHDEEQIERIMNLINQLPTMQQTVIRLRHIDGLQMADIAKLTGTTEQAVRQSISRARRAILKNYNKQGL